MKIDKRTNNREKKTSDDPEKISRRKFLKNSLRGGLAVAALGFGSYSFVYEPWNIAIERFNLTIPHLPDFWKGKKLVQVTDIHCSRMVSRKYLKRAFTLAAEEKPDILALTGDYVTSFEHYVDNLKEVLQETLSPLKNLVKLAVPGNHDYWTNIGYITRSLEEAGFTMLINDGVRIGSPGSTLAILGTDDLWTGVINISDLVEGYDRENEAIILLTHNPDIFPEVVENGLPVTLAGHSHGGQVNLPLVGAPIVPCKYVRGFFREGQSLMYVNRGLGVLSIPIRFNCSPEITVFTLI